MPKLFFFLSGEHKTLPFAELEAILEAKNIIYKELQRLPQVLRLDATVDAAEATGERAALTRVCCLELFHCQTSFEDIIRAMQNSSLEDIVEPYVSFVVRVRRVEGTARNLASMALERKLGELILNKVKGARVDLEKPQKTFFGAMSQNSFLFGLKLAEVLPTPLMQRRPRKRPFFHPSAMSPKLARCMVNLTRPRTNDLILDPFCGTGSFLIEAALLGFRVLGSDAKKYMVKGCRRNLEFFDVEYEALAVADAKHLPLTEVDCIVTDPPYGRSASTMGHTTKQIIQEFLTMSSDRMAKRQRICLAAPKTIEIAEIAQGLGYKHVQSHFVYVHRSLTREIAVLEKT